MAATTLSDCWVPVKIKNTITANAAFLLLFLKPRIFWGEASNVKKNRLLAAVKHGSGGWWCGPVDSVLLSKNGLDFDDQTVWTETKKLSFFLPWSSLMSIHLSVLRPSVRSESETLSRFGGSLEQQKWETTTGNQPYQTNHHFLFQWFTPHTHIYTPAPLHGPDRGRARALMWTWRVWFWFWSESAQSSSQIHL